MEEKHLASGSDATENYIITTAMAENLLPRYCPVRRGLLPREKGRISGSSGPHLIFPRRKGTVRGSGLDRWNQSDGYP